MQDLFKRITAEIVDAIEGGAGEFIMPWHGAAILPANATTGRSYSGVNVLLLWAEARRAGYNSSSWATYRQWAELGAQVRKGEAATTVLFWKTISAGGDDDGDRADQSDRPVRFIARAFRIFNADQVDGIEKSVAPSLSQEARVERAERFFKQLPAAIWYGGASAFYDPGADMVSIPDFGKFRSPEAFYGVLAHELVHWSGANHRLGRDLNNRFGTEAYAMEELVAELGAAFLGAQLCLKLEPRKDHAPYLANWLRVLRGDPRAIVTAASKAQIAVAYLTELAGITFSNIDAGEGA